MKNFETLENLEKFNENHNELESLQMEIIEDQNDPEWCARYISWRLNAATNETDESKKKEILKGVFGYICSMEKVKYTGWNLQELSIAQITSLDQYALDYFRTLNPNDYTNESYKKESMNKVVVLLANRLKQIDQSFKG